MIYLCAVLYYVNGKRNSASATNKESSIGNNFPFLCSIPHTHKVYACVTVEGLDRINSLIAAQKKINKINDDEETKMEY